MQNEKLNGVDREKIIKQAVAIAHQKASQTIDNAVSFYSNIAVLTTLASTVPNSLDIYERQLISGVNSLKTTPEILGFNEELTKLINVNELIDQQLKSYLDCIKILKEQVEIAMKEKDEQK